MEPKFRQFDEFKESEKSLKHEIGVNLKILLNINI